MEKIIKSANTKSFRTTFYNPAVSCLALDFSLSNGTLQIEIAGSLNKSFKGFVPKGEKVYDWENKVSFSLSWAECFEISQNWKAVLDGKYRNPKEQKEKYAGNMAFVHNKSRLYLEKSSPNPKYPNAKPCLIIKIGEENKTVGYMLRVSELMLFISFVEYTSKKLQIDKALFGAELKAYKQLLFNSDTQKDNNNGNNSNKSNYQNQQSNPQASKTYDSIDESYSSDKGDHSTSSYGEESSQEIDEFSSIEWGDD